MAVRKKKEQQQIFSQSTSAVATLVGVTSSIHLKSSAMQEGENWLEGQEALEESFELNKKNPVDLVETLKSFSLKEELSDSQTFLENGSNAPPQSSLQIPPGFGFE